MTLLSPKYAALEPFAAAWAIPDTAGRAAKRGDSTPEERQAFYDAVQPLAAHALDELDAKPLEALDAQEIRLLDLLLAFGHVSLAVEIQGDAEAEHTRWRNCMRITRAPADLPT